MVKGKDTLTVIVGGTSVEVEVNLNAPLHTIIPKALAASKNVGQPPEQWELKDEKGVPLPLDKKIGEFHFGADVALFLSLKAGVNGA